LVDEIGVRISSVDVLRGGQRGGRIRSSLWMRLDVLDRIVENISFWMCFSPRIAERLRQKA